MSAPVRSSSNTMVLDTPLLRVSRPVAACSRCRAAKVKCDGKLPACTACEKSNRVSECSSTNDQFARGKERSYVATLESKVERIEKRIAETAARRKSSSVVMADASHAPSPRPASSDTLKASSPISKRAARRKEAFDIDNLVSDFGLLAVNATARDFYGFTTEMSYARLIQSASTKEPLPTRHSVPLPPKYAATPLIQHYVNNIFNLVPVFEEASLYASVDTLYSNYEEATPWDRWSVRMILAIACLSQSHQRGDDHYAAAVGHVQAALENAENVLHPGYVSSIQALVLWSIYATMDPHHFDSWTLVGATSRAMVDLGIHQDPSRNIAVSKPKLEIRRRVYWCVYSLDRLTSLVHTRAFSFSDEAANVSFPFHTMTGSPKFSSPQSQVFQQSFDAALDIFRLREIQSEWYMDLFQSGREPWNDAYPYVWKQYARMSEWFQDVAQSTLPSIKSFFQLELLYSYVYLLSPSPRIPHMHEYAQRLVFEHCISYATHLLIHLEKPSNITQPPVTFYDAIRCYMTGRQFVDVLSRNTDFVLDSHPPVPPALSASQIDSEDPLSPPTQIEPPPFPSPAPSDGETLPPEPTRRAISAINDFNSALSNMALRFGSTHWRDRFQRESSAMLDELYQRNVSSPAQEISHTTIYSPCWYNETSSPPQLPHLVYNKLPSTPPQLLPQQPSPFASSVSYTGHQFDPRNISQSSIQPEISHISMSPGQHQYSIPYDSTSNGSEPTWTTPSPQPMPDIPQPSGGQQRRALLYGPGLSNPNALLTAQDNASWIQQQVQDETHQFQHKQTQPYQHEQTQPYQHEQTQPYQHKQTQPYQQQQAPQNQLDTNQRQDLESQPWTQAPLLQTPPIKSYVEDAWNQAMPLQTSAGMSWPQDQGQRSWQ